ncbi:MAG: hypothetical protein ABSB78_03415 [Bacteroidota bacterium]
METSTLVILLVILVILQFGIIGIYLLRRRGILQKKEYVPNYEIVRKALVKQIHALGVRKPTFLIFSARFALEGIREGNARKIQASGLRELQYFIIETIRDRGAQLKIRTAAYLFISYIDNVLDALQKEQTQLEKGTTTLEELRQSWNDRQRDINEVVNTCQNRIKNFFTDRIPNAETFAERETLTTAPGIKISREFATVVVKQTEIHNLARQLSEQIDEALASLSEWFDKKTGSVLIVPILRIKFEERAIERLRALAAERGMSDDDGVPAVVSGLLEVQKLMSDAFVQSVSGNIQMVYDNAQKYFERKSSAVNSRMQRINAALDKFQSLRNDFNAHQ